MKHVELKLFCLKLKLKLKLSLDKIIRIETDTGHCCENSYTNSFTKMSLHDYHVLKGAINSKFVFNHSI